jgi:hypothetical protein
MAKRYPEFRLSQHLPAFMAITTTMMQPIQGLSRKAGVSMDEGKAPSGESRCRQSSLVR